ncbi:MAG: hypothetical protein WCH75_28320, partial [Candidatus Binatia bacterium]
TQAPHGDMGQVTIPWAGAQLGHWQFELTTGSRELFQVLPCGVRYFFAGDKPESRSIELWYPFFVATAAEAAVLKLAVTVDFHAPIESGRCAFGFKEVPAGFPSYLRTRFGHEIALIPTSGSALMVTHVDNRTRLEPAGEFKVKVAGTGPVDLLCGLSGTETIQLQDGEGLKFESGNPAFAPGFPLRAVSPVGAPVDASGVLLAPNQRTAWVSLAAPGRYSAQPQGGWLYGQDDLIHKNDGDLLGAMDVDQAIVPDQPFPLVPYAGVNTEAVSKEILESFERTVLTPTRRKRIAARADRTPRPPSGNEPAKTFNVTTAAGFVAIIGAENQWQSIRLGQSGGKQFGFDRPSVELQSAFQSSELFLVVANAQKLGGSFHNAVDFDGWKLTAQVGQNSSYGDYSNVVIVKGRKGKIIDLVANPNLWNDAATFAAPSLREEGGNVSAPDPSQLVQLSHWLQRYANDADRSGSGELAEFKTLINDENWTGVLVLKATVTPPEELAGLTSAADPQRFYAHHFGIAVTPIDGAKVEQSGDSATFGLVQYYDGACVPFVEPAPVPSDPGATFDFKLLMLRAR